MQDILTQVVQPAVPDFTQMGQGTGAIIRITPAPSSGAAGNDRQEAAPSDSGQQDIARVVDQLNQELQSANKGLRFSIDDESGRIVVKVIDTDTEEVIRQIPSEEMLAIARKAKSGEGMIFDVKA